MAAFTTANVTGLSTVAMAALGLGVDVRIVARTGMRVTLAVTASLVVLGLMSSKHAAAESKDDVKRRIEEATHYVPLEQCALSHQCGFSSTAHGNDLTEADQWVKLNRLVDIAREVWGDA